MIEVQVQTLIVSSAPTPCVLVLRPVDDEAAAETDDHVSTRIIPIWVGVNEATQLGVALEKAKFARPTTHDLMLDAVTSLGATVDHVLINDARGQTFFAKLTLDRFGEMIELDARPSDAIALAIRQEAPVYVTEEVLDRASFPFVFRKKASVEQELEEFKGFLETLEPEDFA